MSCSFGMDTSLGAQGLQAFENRVTQRALVVAMPVD